MEGNFYQDTFFMQQQKQERFLRLYKGVHDRFERFCRARACGDMPYEDLMNESLMVAFQKIDQLEKESSFLPFLIGISRRLLANHRRKQKLVAVADESMLVNYADPDDQVNKRVNVAFLHQALAFLPEAQREALILFEITGFSIKEIAQLQDSSEAAIKQRLSRGRKSLATVIKNKLLLKTGDAL